MTSVPGPSLSIAIGTTSSDASASSPPYQVCWRVDARLADGVTVGALADKKPLRASRERQDARIDERVVEHEVGGVQPRHRFPRQQFRVARSGAHDRHMSGHRSPARKATAELAE